MLLYAIFVATLALADSQSLNFVHNPSTVLVDASAPGIDTGDVGYLVGRMLGLRFSRDSWAGLRRNTLRRPKADLLIVVHGVDTPQDLGFSCGGASCVTATTNAEVDLTKLKRQMKKTFGDAAEVVTVGVDETEMPGNSASATNLAFVQSLSFIERIDGALSIAQKFHLRLNASNPPEASFLADLQSLSLRTTYFMAETGALRLAQAPIVFVYQIKMPAGAESSKEMEKILGHVLHEIVKNFTTIYSGDEIAVQLLTLPSGDGSFRAPIRVRRDVGSDEQKKKKNDDNIASHYDANYPLIFNISIWTGVFFAVTVYLVSYAIWHMDPGVEGIVYKMTMPRRRDY